MGACPLFSGSYDEPISITNRVKNLVKRRKNPPPNPNPQNFHFVKVQPYNGHIVAEIQYDDCTNYEGRKIILFRDTDFSDIKHLDKIDPHFTSVDRIKPFARFEPTEEGWKYAVKLCCIL